MMSDFNYKQETGMRALLQLRLSVPGNHFYTPMLHVRFIWAGNYVLYFFSRFDDREQDTEQTKAQRKK